MVAQVCGLKAKEFIHTFGDLIYTPTMLSKPKTAQSQPSASTTDGNQPSSDQIDGFTIDDFKLVNYDPHPSIRAPSPFKPVDLPSCHT